MCRVQAVVASQIAADDFFQEVFWIVPLIEDAVDSSKEGKPGKTEREGGR